MANKVLKKAQVGTLLDGEKKTTSKSKDPSGNYKIKMSQESGEGKIKTTGKVRRTLKGFFSGAPRVGKALDYSNESTYKSGGMIKRADGSMSKRGLWDNIRANKGSGKKPTSAMLKQEKKIKAQTKKK
jgi:hypothetical protein